MSRRCSSKIFAAAGSRPTRLGVPVLAAGASGFGSTGFVSARRACFDGEHVAYVANIPARRFKCGSCHARWTRAPERVPSRAHYQPCVVAHAVAEAVLCDGGSLTSAALTHDCSQRSLGRWVERVASLAEPAALARELVAEAEVPVMPAPPVPMSAPSSTPVRAFGARAVWILALLDALASLRGLEPPGLAYADILVPAVARTQAVAEAPSSAGDQRKRCT